MPFFLTAVAENFKAVSLKGKAHFITAPVNNAGADENAVLCHKAPGKRGEIDDHICHYVGQHQLIARAQGAAKGGILYDVAEVFLFWKICLPEITIAIIKKIGDDIINPIRLKTMSKNRCIIFRMPGASFPTFI